MWASSVCRVKSFFIHYLLAKSLARLPGLLWAVACRRAGGTMVDSVAVVEDEFVPAVSPFSEGIFDAILAYTHAPAGSSTEAEAKRRWMSRVYGPDLRQPKRW